MIWDGVQWWMIILIVIITAIIIVSVNILYKDKLKLVKTKRKKDIEGLQQQLKNDDLSAKDRIKLYVKLANKYRNGIPDVYTKSGKKIEGDKPDLNKTILYLTKAVRLGYKKGYVKLAEIMMQGSPTFPPNFTLARACLLKGKETIHNPRTLERLDIIEERLNELTAFNGNDVKYPTVCTVCKRDINIRCPRCHGMLHAGPMVKCFHCDFTLPAGYTNECPYCHVAIDREARENIALVQDFIAARDIPQREITIREELWQNNAQSAHDHAVVKGVKEAITALKTTVPRTKRQQNIQQSIQEAKEYARNNFKLSQALDAIRVMETIHTHGGEQTSYGGSEWEVFSLMWDKIRNDDDKKRNFIIELASAIENGMVVCTGGRIGRMVNSLNGIDDEVKIIHTDMIKQEMLNAVPIVRASLMDKYSAEEQELIESPKENAVQKKFETELKAKLHTKFHNDYVAKGLMTTDAFNKEIKVITDAIG